ncbi:GNAT family N-acetyltransferase [Cellulomonas sp. PhB143]|uniref:GNAT family N-acetyltransferase n=1 Tax=Cellulomonas sp. PhB143 TaxID=2485186 RepID=UPI000F477CF1|nr:GNAT family N-acetyltransferase [Cellulomonas sp. PhB143]ROS73532.1 hypothetical protein EDF32_2381 [Cellulomonas sp. PhB143]
MTSTTTAVAESPTERDVVVRKARDEDLARIVELNNASTPAVPETGARDMRELVEASTLTLVAAEPGSDEALGFLVAFDGGLDDFDAENYAWFEERGFDHYYVDRIVVGDGARGRGVGQRFYEEIFAVAKAEGRESVTCEVNIDPMNAGSLRFHGRLGFEGRGEQRIHEDTVTVRKLAAPVV